MYTCVLCRFLVYLDDTIAASLNGNCVCLHCYLKETDNLKDMPRDFQRELVEAAGPLPNGG